MGGGRESGRSILAARHDDDKDISYIYIYIYVYIYIYTYMYIYTYARKKSSTITYISVVAIKKGAFCLPSTTVTNFTLYIYIYIYMCVCVCVCACKVFLTNWAHPSDSVKCKQTEVNTYTLNSPARVVSVAGCELCYQVDVKLSGFRSKLEASCVSNHI